MTAAPFRDISKQGLDDQQDQPGLIWKSGNGVLMKIILQLLRIYILLLGGS
jgi:hypothetical protein